MVSIGVQGGVYRQAACLQCPARPRMLCAGMTNELLPALGSIATDVRLDKGETLFYEGDDAKYVYNVKKGYVRLSRLGVDGRRQVMGFLTVGDYMGHTGKSQYAISAEALTDAEVCRFSRSDLESLLSQYPQLERQFHHMTAGLLDDMLDLLFTLGRKNAIERVASFLDNALDRQIQSDEPATQIWLPMTRADIADFLGLTLETVSRAFSRLRKEGVIDIEHAHTIHILQRARLIDIASGDG